MLFGRAFAVHGPYNPGRANPFLRGAILFLAAASAHQVNDFHVKKESNKILAPIQCPPRSAPWEK
jgi:hypothetical protein